MCIFPNISVDLVKDINLTRGLEDLLNILDPIAITTDNLQKSTFKIADVVCAIKHLEFQLSTFMRDNEDIKAICEKRFKYIIKRSHLAAYILSPTHKGNQIETCSLTTRENELAMDFIKEQFPILLPLALKFTGGLHPFQHSSSYMQLNNMAAITDSEWWTIMQKTYPNDISMDQLKCLQSLLTANASSSNLERIFSKFGLVHTDIRNRLGSERASQLVYLHHKLNQD